MSTRSVRLGDVISKVGSGSTPRGGEEAYKPEGVPFIRSLNVHFDGLRRSGLVYLDNDQALALRNVEVRAGDVLLNITGASIGRVTCAPADLDGARVNQHVCIIRPTVALDSSYLRWYLASPFMQRLIGGIESGATRQALTKEKILGFEVPLLERAEQRRTVAEIEKQFSRLDEAVANLQRVKQSLARYRASVLVDASDRPEDHAAHVTVGSLLREPIVNGLSVKESATPTAVRALRLSAMTATGLNFDDHRFLPIDARKVEDILVKEGDFFVSRGNGSLHLVGRGVTAQAPSVAVIFPDTMMRLRFVDPEVARWVAMLWPSRLVRRQIEQRVKTTAGIYKIAQPQLASITVPLPPLTTRRLVIAEVDRRLSIVRGVEAQVDANLKRAQALRQAVLAKAFSGAH